MNKIVNLRKNLNNCNKINKINDENGGIVEDPKKISNIFNNYFTTIGSKLSKTISIPNNNVNNLINDDTISDSFFLCALTPADVKKYILQLKPNKATKSNSVPTIIIKKTVNIISPIISQIFNKCIEESVFPDSLKSAEVRPIYKKGNKLLPSNHRPISILDPFSKIFELHLHNQITKFVSLHNILHPFQYGFRTNSSTDMAVTQIIEDITDKIQKGEFVCSVFLDLAKAFDTVDHNILLNKLYKYGIRGLPAKLIRSYLTDRKQQTIINNIQSDISVITCGVPQGSILGPLLFNIYINDIIKASKFTVKLFADDACLLCSSKDPIQLEKMVNAELININTWRQFNKLSVNFSKSNYIIFTNKKNKHQFNINMDKYTLEQTYNTKYLGVIMDHKLQWNRHIDYIINKISKSAYMLSKVRHYVDLDSLKMLYYTLIHPYLNYCLTAWGGAPISTLKPLITFQKKVIRIITKSKFDHPSTELFTQLGILPLPQQYNLNISILMHKTSNNNITGNYNLIKANKIHNYNTRFAANSNYYRKFNKLNLGLNTFTAKGSQLWSKIPLNLKSLPLHLFKKQLKQHLLIILNEQIT